MEGRSLAHIKSRGGSESFHPLDRHLKKVSRLAEVKASIFGGAPWAGLAGLWHDLGKYSDAFQTYIKSASGYDAEAHIETTPGKVNHSDAGAQYAVEQFGVYGRAIAYLIAGHHAGLPDWYKLDAPGASLQQRLQATDNLKAALAADIPLDILEQPQPTSPLSPGGADGFALWIRLLFSCLVDADFLDTEAFMDADKAKQRSGYAAFTTLLPHFDAFMEALAAKAASSKVNQLRAEILEQCRQCGREAQGLFSLTVPTGGGKTLASMAFALEHAKHHGHRRVIYAIPYTSIIEQTAEVFRGIFPDAVIEHHSNVDPANLEKETSRSRLATENWDAPIIVTTNVQFFESLFAARTSRCRKLHNIVNSVVILDEAQLLPPEFMQPILGVIKLLSEHYGVSFVFSTATQPALNTRKDNFGKTLLDGLDNVREIIADPDHLYEQLERVEVTMPDDFHTPRSWEEIAADLQQYDSALAIVNTRNDARVLHQLMPKGTYHLSALMCGQHRSDVIAEIKSRLKAGRPTLVISTQLVEAGVDLDFPVVYRAMAGLDSIAQAAGRCNREGKLPEKGKVIVFMPPKPCPPGALRYAEQSAISLMTDDAKRQPLARTLFRPYFEHFYSKADHDKYGIQTLLKPEGEKEDALKVQFRSAAQRFKLIDESDYQAVFVRYDDFAKKLISQLEQLGPERWLMRKLQRYTVNISQFHLRALLDHQDIREIHPGSYVQVSDTLYHPTLGLNLDPTDIDPTEMVI